MKKMKYLLLMALLIISLAGCSANTEDETDARDESRTEETEDSEDDEETESESSVSEDTEEEEETEDNNEETQPAAEEVLDALPTGPAGADFGPDNMGFYMQGVEFTLPMAYSDFLAKVTELGWSMEEDGVDECSGGTFVFGEVEFLRPVEGQEDMDHFTIGVINSADVTQAVDLADPNTQVISIYLSLSAGSNDLYDPEAGYYTINLDTEFYITEEIGLGRNIRNVYNAWGGSMQEMHGNWCWTTGDSSRIGLSSYSEPYIDISSKDVDDARVLFRVLLERYGDCEDVITWIHMYNNPFVQ